VVAVAAVEAAGLSRMRLMKEPSEPEVNSFTMLVPTVPEPVDDVLAVDDAVQMPAPTTGISVKMGAVFAAMKSS